MTTAQSIIKSAAELLQDLDGINWSAGFLVDALNAGAKEVSVLHPDLMTKTATVALVAGPRQTVPADCLALTEIPVRQADLAMLDAVDPTWPTRTGVQTIKHFCYDQRDPSTFHVYPTAAVGASLDLIYVYLPADVAAPSGATYSMVTGNINTPDVTATALVHYCMFRAYAVDSEMINPTLSAAHYALFKQMLSDELTGKSAVKPTVTP